MIAKPVLGIGSHVGVARFYAECAPEPLGEIERAALQPIPSPYHDSPTWMVNSWKGRRVIVTETAHKRYQVYELPAEAVITPLEAETPADTCPHSASQNMGGACEACTAA